MSEVQPPEPVAFEGPDFTEVDYVDDEIDIDADDLGDDAGNRVAGGTARAVLEPDDLGDDAGNRVAGGTARAVLEHVARSIVDDPDAVLVEVSDQRGTTKLSLHVAPSDMGRIIGKRGRVAQALRAVVRAAAARDDTDATVDIVD